MPKRAEHSTPLGGDEKQARSQPSPAPTGKREGDARDEKSELKKNRKDLGVGEDHKTGDMDKRHRGTFP